MFADLHHHLIYGVDDGPKTFEETQRMIERASQNGVSVIAATSHAEPGRARFPIETYQSHLREAQDWCREAGIPLEIVPGAEIFYADNTVRLLEEGQIPTLNGGRAVLIEFSPGDTYDHIYRAVRTVGNAGYTVIVAHAERYKCLRKLPYISELREDLGAYIQINAGTLIAPDGFFDRRWVRKLLEMDACDLAATDAHNTGSRPCRMQKCYQTLAEEWGEERAQRLCVTTPRRLLGRTDGQAF